MKQKKLTLEECRKTNSELLAELQHSILAGSAAPEIARYAEVSNRFLDFVEDGSHSKTGSFHDLSAFKTKADQLIRVMQMSRGQVPDEPPQHSDAQAETPGFATEAASEGLMFAAATAFVKELLTSNANTMETAMGIAPVADEKTKRHKRIKGGSGSGGGDLPGHH